MLKKRCNICDTEMSKKYTEDGIRYFCNNCSSFSEYSIIEETAFCEKCGEPLSENTACGCLDLFCKKCNELKSKKCIIWNRK